MLAAGSTAPQAAPVGDGDLTPAEVVHRPRSRPASGRSARRRPAPTAPPVSGSPSANGGTYDRVSFIRPRMYGSTETKALRTCTSPAPGSETSTSASSKSEGTGAPLGREARRISREWTATSGIVRRFGRYPVSRWPFAALTESFKNVVSVPRGSSSCGHRRATHARQERTLAVVAEGRSMRRFTIILHSASPSRSPQGSSTPPAPGPATSPTNRAPTRAATTTSARRRPRAPRTHSTSSSRSRGTTAPSSPSRRATSRRVCRISNNGNVRGTPTTAGSYTFYLTVSWKTTPPCVSAVALRPEVHDQRERRRSSAPSSRRARCPMPASARPTPRPHSAWRTRPSARGRSRAARCLPG